MKVPIQNLYYLLCFAWRFAPENLAINVGAIPASADVLELFSHVLASAMNYLFRRGIDQGYLLHEEHIPRIRGRLNVTQTVRYPNWSKPSAICHFDDFSPNVLHNQIIRATAEVLMRAPSIDPQLRDRLRAVYVNMSGVSCVQVTDELFRRVQIHRNNRHYAFLLFICRLVHSLNLPSSEEGAGRFRDLLSDERAMEKVFEEFLRNFYRLKQHEFARVGSVNLSWRAESVGQGDLSLLPEMRTDVTLKSDTRTIVIDAKYYKDALKEHYGKKRAHSGNLYQLLAYLRAAEATGQGAKPEGILIYPAGTSEIDESYVIDGYPVRLYTLNLDQRWQDIESDLLALLNQCNQSIRSESLTPLSEFNQAQL